MTLEETRTYVEWCVDNNQLDLLVMDIQRLEEIETSDPKLDIPEYTFILSDTGMLFGAPPSETNLKLGPLSYEVAYPVIKIENFYEAPDPPITLFETIFWCVGSGLVGYVAGSF